MSPELQVDDRIWVGAGYEPDPAWLAASPDGYAGRVANFIPGQNEQPAAMIELDEEIVLPAGTVAEHEVKGAFSFSNSVTWALTGLPRRRVYMSSFATPNLTRRVGRIASTVPGSSRTPPIASSTSDPLPG